MQMLHTSDLMPYPIHKRLCITQYNVSRSPHITHVNENALHCTCTDPPNAQPASINVLLSVLHHSAYQNHSAYIQSAVIC